MRPLRIGIVGGSLAGLFAGILFRHDGHDVRIYERSSKGLAGRGAGLVPQTEVFQILREIGVEHLAKIGVLSQDRIYLTKSGFVSHRDHLPQMQISWDHLYSVLLDKFDSENYVLSKAVAAVKHEDTAAILEFQDGSVEAVDMVIGADGIGSIVRSTINSHSQNTYAGYVAWRGLISESDLSASTRSLIGNLTFYLSDGNQALGYLVPGSAGDLSEGNRRYNWVWYRVVDASDLSQTLTGMSGRTSRFSLPRGELSEVRRRSLREDALSLLPPQFAMAVELETTPSVQAIFDYSASSMSNSVTALIGDAAFVARPHTAMGVAKAAGDVLSLRAHLRQTNDLALALRRYEAERIIVGREIVSYGQQLGRSSMR